MGEYRERHAVRLQNGKPIFLSRIDGNGPDDIYRAARELARTVGIDLEG